MPSLPSGSHGAVHRSKRGGRRQVHPIQISLSTACVSQHAHTNTPAVRETSPLAVCPLHLGLSSVRTRPKDAKHASQVLRAGRNRLGAPKQVHLSPNDPIHGFYPMQPPPQPHRKDRQRPDRELERTSPPLLGVNHSLPSPQPRHHSLESPTNMLRNTEEKRTERERERDRIEAQHSLVPPKVQHAHLLHYYTT